MPAHWLLLSAQVVVAAAVTQKMVARVGRAVALVKLERQQAAALVLTCKAIMAAIKTVTTAAVVAAALVVLVVPQRERPSPVPVVLA